MTINQRVEEIIKDLYDGNKRAFSIAIGVSSSVIENIVGKRKSLPSYEVTRKIIHSIESINIEWLMIGRGSMLNLSNTIQGDRNPLGNNSDAITGHNIGDNSINIAAPTSGDQKNIHPDRTTEIDQSTQDSVAEPCTPYVNSNEIITKQKEEISKLKAEIIRLQNKLIDRLERDK